MNKDISSWMNWGDIFSTSCNNYEFPTHVTHNIYILLIVIFGIAFIQLFFAISAKDKKRSAGVQAFFYLSFILLFIFGIFSAYKMFMKIYDESYVFAGLCEEAKSGYPIATGEDVDIFNYTFTSEIYRTIAIVIVSFYILIIISIKLKNIPAKLVSGILAGVILITGIIAFVYSEKQTSVLNDRISIYYTGETVDELFHW